MCPKPVTDAAIAIDSISEEEEGPSNLMQCQLINQLQEKISELERQLAAAPSPSNNIVAPPPYLTQEA